MLNALKATIYAQIASSIAQIVRQPGIALTSSSYGV
jgi:hypothetical protein